MTLKITFLFAYLFFSLAATSRTFALDTTSTKFFPLKIGNSWTYYYFVRPAPPYPEYGYRYKTSILKDTLINSHKYYYLSIAGYFSTNMNIPMWIRIDSVTGALITPSSCTGKGYDLLDSLSSSLQDTSYKCLRQPSDGRVYSLLTTFTIFGVQTQTKVFDATITPLTFKRKYSRNFGIIRTEYGEAWYYSHDLLGCILDGVVYGDTSLTSVINITGQLPGSFAIGQNYPNPFNPSTFISFDIPKSVHVSLEIFDIAGHKSATLIEQNMTAGSYRVEFDASGLASGVYIYRLTADDFTESKRMVLLK